MSNEFKKGDIVKLKDGQVFESGLTVEIVEEVDRNGMIKLRRSGKVGNKALMKVEGEEVKTAGESEEELVGRLRVANGKIEDLEDKVERLTKDFKDMIKELDIKREKIRRLESQVEAIKHIASIY